MVRTIKKITLNHLESRKTLHKRTIVIWQFGNKQPGVFSCYAFSYNLMVIIKHLKINSKTDNKKQHIFHLKMSIVTKEASWRTAVEEAEH